MNENGSPMKGRTSKTATTTHDEKKTSACEVKQKNSFEQKEKIYTIAKFLTDS